MNFNCAAAEAQKGKLVKNYGSYRKPEEEEVVFEVKRAQVTACIPKPCLTGIHLFPWPPLFMSPAFRLCLWHSGDQIFMLRCKNVFFFLISAVYSEKNYYSPPPLPFLLRKKRRRGKKSITSCSLALPLLAMQNNASG